MPLFKVALICIFVFDDFVSVRSIVCFCFSKQTNSFFRTLFFSSPVNIFDSIRKNELCALRNYYFIINICFVQSSYKIPMPCAILAFIYRFDTKAFHQPKRLCESIFSTIWTTLYGWIEASGDMNITYQHPCALIVLVRVRKCSCSVTAMEKSNLESHCNNDIDFIGHSSHQPTR